MEALLLVVVLVVLVALVVRAVVVVARVGRWLLAFVVAPRSVWRRRGVRRDQAPVAEGAAGLVLGPVLCRP